MGREADVQPSHPSSRLHECRFGFLLLKEIIVGYSPIVLVLKKMMGELTWESKNCTI
jgi:hypothetical protein